MPDTKGRPILHLLSGKFNQRKEGPAAYRARPISLINAETSVFCSAASVNPGKGRHRGCSETRGRPGRNTFRGSNAQPDFYSTYGEMLDAHHAVAVCKCPKKRFDFSARLKLSLRT